MTRKEERSDYDLLGIIRLYQLMIQSNSGIKELYGSTEVKCYINNKNNKFTQQQQRRKSFENCTPSFVSTRDYEPDRQRVEDRKLKKIHEREAKGDARELRKDKYFLAEAKARDKARLDEEKAEEHGRARAFLQEQEHAFKSR
ncbi:nucleolar protein 14 [Tanacetum coccineum]